MYLLWNIWLFGISILVFGGVSIYVLKTLEATWLLSATDIRVPLHVDHTSKQPTHNLKFDWIFLSDVSSHKHYTVILWNQKSFIQTPKTFKHKNMFMFGGKTAGYTQKNTSFLSLWLMTLKLILSGCCF